MHDDQQRRHDHIGCQVGRCRRRRAEASRITETKYTVNVSAAARAQWMKTVLKVMTGRGQAQAGATPCSVPGHAELHRRKGGGRWQLGACLCRAAAAGHPPSRLASAGAAMNWVQLAARASSTSTPKLQQICEGCCRTRRGSG